MIPEAYYSTVFFHRLPRSKCALTKLGFERLFYVMVKDCHADVWSYCKRQAADAGIDVSTVSLHDDILFEAAPNVRPGLRGASLGVFVGLSADLV